MEGLGYILLGIPDIGVGQGLALILLHVGSVDVQIIEPFLRGHVDDDVGVFLD